MVAPARERGLKCSFTGEGMAEVDGRSREGAWIEILSASESRRPFKVAPARERGLKLNIIVIAQISDWSLPRGSVD